MVLRGNCGDSSPAASSPWSSSKGSQVETAVEHVGVICIHKSLKILLVFLFQKHAIGFNEPIVCCWYIVVEGNV